MAVAVDRGTGAQIPLTTTPIDWPGLERAPEPKFSLVVIGDVRLEFRARLPDRRFSDLTTDHFAYAPVEATVSGTAVNLARRAVSWFHRVAVIAKIGDDVFTAVIEQQLQLLGVATHLRLEKGMPNGFSILLRDQDDEAGVRLMIASRSAPSFRLSSADVRACAPALAGSDVVMTDGYSLLSHTSRAALMTAAAIARQSRRRVVVDLVPHDIDRRLPSEDVMPALTAADLVISEAGTVARVVGRSAQSVRDIHGLLPILDQAVDNTPLWLLRHGEGGMQHVLAYQRDRLLLEYQTGYTQASEKNGFGDRLAVSELYWWLSGTAC